MRRVQNAKMKYVESNPELESNANVRVLWNGYNPVQHKRRRSYIKKLNA